MVAPIRSINSQLKLLLQCGYTNMLKVYSDTIKFHLSATVQDQGNSGSFHIRAEERELRPGSLELWEDGSRVGWRGWGRAGRCQFGFTGPVPLWTTLSSVIGPMQLKKVLAKSANPLLFPRMGTLIKLVLGEKKGLFYFVTNDLFFF